MLMMLPLPWACMARTSCFMLRTTPRTLVSNVAAKLSAVWSVIRPIWPCGGVVHRDIETAKPCDGILDHGAVVVFLANVGMNELGLGTQRTQLLDQLIADFITTTGNDHLRALLGEGDGSGAPDAGESTGNQDNRLIHGHLLD